MENMNIVLRASGSNNEAEVLEMLQPVSNIEDMESFKSEDHSGASDSQLKLTIDDSRLLTPESRSSTPTSGTDYKSCSNPSTPERPQTFGRKDSLTSQPEATCSINMSANIASKLNQMRVSRENMDSTSQSSYEELASGEELSSQPPLNSGSRGSPPATGRRPSKPSLRQVFPYISCLPFENNVVFCFVLSVWDNIVGPQTVYVWKRKAFPSQKTFDLFDDKEGLEVGEDSMEHKPFFQRSKTNLERHPSTASQEECVQGRQKRQNEINNASSHPERHSSTTQEISPSKQVKKSCDHMAKQSCNEKLHSSSEESLYHETGEEAAGSVKVHKDQNRTTSQGKVSLKFGNSEDKAAVEEVRQKPSSPINTGQNSDSVGEPERQEFGSSWACGRSRLRIGKVVWYVTVHSVGVGQVGPSSEKITSSLHVVPHQGIIIVAARFTVEEEEDGAVPYCLSMVVPLEEYNNFLPLTQTVTSWLVTIAATTRLLITKHGLEGGGRVKCKLVELCDVLVALRSASLDQYPLTPAGRPPDDRRFAEIILTSHLQTMGSSVVVADSPNAANKVVMWIAQFSDPTTLHASRLCLSYAQWPFHPGLFIQGIVRSSNGEVNLSAQKLIQSSRPLTVVDVNRGTVKQTGAPDVHARRNSSALHQELLSLWHDLPDVSVPSESLLEPIRGAAPLVKRFLHDYDRLNSCSNEVRQNFIQAFLRSLQYTALALITWTQHEWSAQRRRSGYGSLRRALCSVFDLEELDLRVVLAQAEILEPGFYSYVTSMSQ